MGRIRVGTASWTDKTLLDSGWYPDSVKSAEKRLAYYADTVPAGRGRRDLLRAAGRADRRAVGRSARPTGFTFNIKAYSLLTGHPTKVSVDLQGPAAGDRQDERLPGRPAAAGVRGGLDPVPVRARPAGRGGQAGRAAVPVPAVVHHPPVQQGVPARGAPSGAARCGRLSSSATRPGSTGDNRDETLEFLRQHKLPYVCVDMPQGHKSSIPPVLEATADLAVVRFHGHSDKWTSKDIYEKFGYDYSRARSWRSGRRSCASWPTRPSETHVLMNNCYSDYAQTQRRGPVGDARRLTHPYRRCAQNT